MGKGFSGASKAWAAAKSFDICHIFATSILALK
jgi:hypothetical protein